MRDFPGGALVKTVLPMQGARVGDLVRELRSHMPYSTAHTEKEDSTTQYDNTWGFPCGSAGKESACIVGDLGSIPRLGKSPREGKGYLLQYSGLENSMDSIAHGVAKSRT